MVAPNESQGVSDLLGLTSTSGERETNRKLICFYSAQGLPAEQIAEMLDVSDAMVDVVTSSDEGASMVILLQNSFNEDPKQRLKRISHIAIDKQMKVLLTSTDDKVIAQISEKLLDRAEGKAIQTIENRNLNVNVDASKIDDQLDAQTARLNALKDMEQKLLASQLTANPINV